MNRKKKATVLLILAILLFIGAIASIIIGVGGMLDPLTGFATVKSPGSLELALENTEPLSMWHTSSTSESSRPNSLPKDFSFSLTQEDGSQIPYLPVAADEKHENSIVNKRYRLIGRFEIPQSGDYRLDVTGPPDEVFSLIMGEPTVSLASLFWGVGFTVLLGLLSLILFVVSLVFFLKKGPPSLPTQS